MSTHLKLKGDIMDLQLNITIEGIDFTGKSTLATNLAKSMKRDLFTFPSKHTKAGWEARASLSNEEISFEQREYLFLKDAYVNGELINDHRNYVVTDRSPLSQMAYREALGMDGDTYLNDVKRVGGYLPDLTVLLTVNETYLKKRMELRGGSLDVMENVDISLMMKRQKCYEEVLIKHKMHYVTVDTSFLTIDEVLDQVNVKLQEFDEVVNLGELK